MDPSGRVARHSWQYSFVLVLAVGLSVAASSAHAETWRIAPSVSLSELGTDNVNLTPSNVAQSDLVTQLTPSLLFSGIGTRARIIGDISVPIVFYARTGSENNSVYPTASVFGSMEAIEKWLYIDGVISITQPFLSPFGAQPTSVTNNTQNRYTQETYKVSPYMKGETPGNVYYELRNNSYWSNANGVSSATTIAGTPVSTSNSYTSEWLARIESPVVPLGWAVRADAVNVKFSNQNAQKMGLATVGPKYAYSPQVRLSLIAGYEDNRFPYTSYTGGVYGGGIEWHPTARTNVVANVEHRFFGTSFLVNLDHRTPLSVGSFSASRGITTYAQQLASATGTGSVTGLLNQLFTSRIPDAKERQEAVDEFTQRQNLPATLSTPVNSYSEQVLLSENVSATAGLLGSRNSLFVTAYYLRTEPISGAGNPLPEGLAAQNNNTQTGVDVVWSHNLTSTAVLNFTGFATRTKANAPYTGETNQGGVRLDLAVPLSAHTTFSTGARYQSLGSNVAPGYTEKAIYAGLTYAFK
jgi:uncharacterized protein (PEP-CTERM system associated)